MFLQLISLAFHLLHDPVMAESHGSWLFTCFLNVHSHLISIETLLLIANLFLEILFFFNFPVARSMDVHNSFIRILVNFLVGLGAGGAILLLEKLLVVGACNENFQSIKILMNRCWDAFEEWLLKPLLEYLEERRELMQVEEDSDQEKRDTDEASKSRVNLDDKAGDAEEGVASWVESGDASETIGVADTRTDSREPISLFEDVFVVLFVSDVKVDCVGRYFDLRRACFGWVAVVFCTAVLGYDKGVVIK